jgi:putative CocE/NonD family hydrolase
MLIDAGPRDQRAVQALTDYGLIYCGEALGEDLIIAGEVRVTLSVQSNCPDTDFVAKLIDLHPDGRAMLLMDGVVRAMYRGPSGEPHHFAPDRVELLTINFGHICHTLGAGHRIELDVTSSNFPRRARNTNSGNPILATVGDTDIRVATNTIQHAETTPSFLELSVLRTLGALTSRGGGGP